MDYSTIVLNKIWLTDNVFLLTIKRPQWFTYNMGQAVDITLNKNMVDFTASFTIASVYGEDDNLQFIIKLYREHHGITTALAQLKFNDSIQISSARNSFVYKGQGVFIAAGSGITPFVPLIRMLYRKNRIKGHQLIVANKKASDIILYDELKNILDDQFYNVLSRDHLSVHNFGYINRDYLSRTIRTKKQFFYICGPSSFLNSMRKNLKMLNVDKDLIQTIF